MRIMITEVARDQLSKLDTDTQRRVLDQIRQDLPGAVATDIKVKVKELDERVQVHTLENGPLVFYREDESQDEGTEQRLVILTFVDPEEVTASRDFFRSAPAIRPPASFDTKIGYDVLSQLSRVDA